ncbi:MAG: transposase [Phycisphaerales bacterium]|nr:transposase [Phycisphaerales bacterium]
MAEGVFADVTDAKALAASWRHEYNHQRTHSSRGYVPPAVFAARCGRPAQNEETPAADAPRCAAGIAGGEIVLEDADTMARL